MALVSLPTQAKSPSPRHAGYRYSDFDAPPLMGLVKSPHLSTHKWLRNRAGGGMLDI
jgi:hypothetical protein